MVDRPKTDFDYIVLEVTLLIRPPPEENAVRDLIGRLLNHAVRKAFNSALVASVFSD